MTGYGAGAAEAPGARVTVEIRGVNQRVLDAKVAVPREYAAWETEIREGVRKTAQRGRVEVTVLRTPIPGKRRYRVTVQPALARAYVDAARKLVRTLRLGGSPSLGDVLRLPGLFEVSEAPPDLGRERAALRRALGAALRAFDAERRREGAHLERDMRRRTTQLRALATALGERGPVGKRIDFLVQEVHRELNTTGAKAGDLVITDLVLAAKGELEKLREQVQNVE